MISQCADPIFQPLRAWTDRIHDYNASRDKPTTSGDATSPVPLAAQEWSNQSSAEVLDNQFRGACESELRANVVRLRLYLEDSRTVGVLVQHVQERIMDEYEVFREVAGGMYARALREVLLSHVELRKVLMEVCGEGTGVGGSEK
jgi:acyl transferase domain-containing protein